MPKKVLIITYYWPPAGGPGVQRWLKFVKYLPQFDVEPIVFVPENPTYPITDSSLESEVSEHVTVIKKPIKEPYKLASRFSKNKSKTISKGIIPDKRKQGVVEKLMLSIRGNFFIPDARKSWVKPSVTYLEDYLKVHRIDTVITTGPPHSLHLIGLELKKQLGVHWIADFRDPWTSIGYHKELKLLPFAQKKHKALEHLVLNSANHIIVTSQVTKDEFSGLTQHPISVITNGFDDEKVNQPPLDTKFSLSHIGSLLSKRNPQILWQVLSELVQDVPSFATDLRLDFVGSVSKEVLESMNLYGLTKFVNEVGYVSHNESIVFQKKSQLLLLIEIDSEETKAIIPGKLFEYMAANRPIIALGPKGSDVERIITQSNTGSYFYYDSKPALKEVILKYYLEFQSGSLKTNPIGVQKYHRRELTKVLSNLIRWE
ncbi:glycosyltransferase family 4 protein [Mangrovimonas sp. AS39]|uniref:glycosyltransferase family 4 protein n=1 Tax=Mangrovimonas futianensis TaxID=2895523 RepID=UPI001E2BB2AF|nr:glycosyltransferase family 4 protein [Mangrovimonas futianensis]MCF1195482.1 glycosyltransferase family 4 protein [Mangrovimonas futianensis]